MQATAVQQNVRLAVQVIPNARRSEVVGMHGEALKIRLQAQPVDGQANAELVRFIAERLGLPKKAVSVLQGQTSKRKLVQIAGITYSNAAEVMDILLPPTGGRSDVAAL